MDDLLNRDGSRGVVNVVLGLLGIGGGMKLISTIANKWMDRRITLDLYQHQDHATSEERAWKRVGELEEHVRTQDKDIDRLMREKFDAERIAAMNELRLQSQMEQNTLLCAKNAEQAETIDDLEAHVAALIRQLKDARGEA